MQETKKYFIIKIVAAAAAMIHIIGEKITCACDAIIVVTMMDAAIMMPLLGTEGCQRKRLSWQTMGTRLRSCSIKTRFSSTPRPGGRGCDYIPGNLSFIYWEMKLVEILTSQRAERVR